jgi:hypothetical protein
MLAFCGSGMLMPDPGSEFFHPGSRVVKITDPVSGSAVFLTQKNDPGCSYRIRIFPSRIRIPDPGVEKATDPGSGSATLHASEACSTPHSFIVEEQELFIYPLTCTLSTGQTLSLPPPPPTQAKSGQKYRRNQLINLQYVPPQFYTYISKLRSTML